jgi:hypothetical protein
MPHAHPHLSRLIFASRATPASGPYIDGALGDIVAEAIPQNRRRGITGILIYHRGWFISGLEGAPEKVFETFSLISADERHQNTTILSEEPATTRLFTGWAMAARILSKRDTAALKGFDDPSGFDPTTLPERTITRLVAILCKAHDRMFSAQQRMMTRV